MAHKISRITRVIFHRRLRAARTSARFACEFTSARCCDPIYGTCVRIRTRRSIRKLSLFSLPPCRCPLILLSHAPARGNSWNRSIFRRGPTGTTSPHFPPSRVSFLADVQHTPLPRLRAPRSRRSTHAHAIKPLIVAIHLARHIGRKTLFPGISSRSPPSPSAFPLLNMSWVRVPLPRLLTPGY